MIEDSNQTNKSAASITNKNGRYSQNTINNFLSLINKQNTNYSEFSYIGDGSFAFVMKAKNNQNKEVAIKVIEYQDTLSGIDAAKREYSLLRNLTNSDYFIKIQDQFDLVGRPNTSEKIIIPNNRFFVQEQKLCSSNLRELLKQFRANKTNPSDSFKEILAIQMLDGLNLLHSRGVIHKDIKPSNFLVSSNENYSVILKLCDIGLASPWRIHELRKNTLQLQDQGYAHYMAPEVIGIKGKCSIQSDLFSLGIVLLELDNALTFDYSQVTSAEYDKLQEGRIFDNITLNRQSFLYNIASIFLNKSCKDRGSAHKMLLSLINKSNEYKRIPIYSIILGNQLESINYDYFFSSKIKKQMKQYPQQTLVDNTDNKMVNGITSELNQPQSKINSQLTTELIKSALRIIFAQGDYDVDLQLLHISLHTIIFGATNIKKNIKCALKLSLCQHKPDVIRKIGIIRICQTPYILRLINFRFFQDTLNNEFILYEFERSNYSLSHYLLQQQINGEYSQQLKEQIMFQMIDSINFLHKNDIIHGNITLDSFLVSVNEQGGIEVKLADFNNADMVLSHSEFDEEQLERDRFYVPPYNCISSQNKMISCDDLYNSPEKQLSLGQFSTQKSDCYSLGLCLVILDNSPSFSEQQLLLDNKAYCFNQSNLDDFPKDNMLINKHTKIYKQATEYLHFSSKQRKPLQICVNDNSTQFTFYSAISEQGFQLPLKQEISIDLQNINDFGNFNTLDQLITMPTLLSLSLDLDNNHTSEIEAKQILFRIINLINLTNLHLNLQNSQINDTVAKDLLIPLQNLINISNLSVNLKSNQIGSIGAQYLLLPINNLSNLSFLSLNLQDNQITDIGASFLLSPLKNLQLLSTLNLNLWNKEIKANENIKQLLAPLSNLNNLQVLSLNLYDNSLSDIGSQYLLAPIISLTNLKTLTIDLWSNQIGQSGAESILSPIQNLKQLQTLSLDLWSNSIGDNGAKCLLSPLVNSLNLLTLSINLISNQITETGAIYLLSPLQNLLNLQTIFLDLNSNQIGDIGAKSLLSSFTNLINLQNLKLNLQNNQIGDIGGKYLFSYLSNLINLQHFSVNFYKNNIGDIGATFLLASFEHLVNIQSISIILGRNVIAVEGAKSLLKPLQNLKQFQYLSLNLMHNLIQTEGANSLLCPLSNILSLLNVKLELKSPELKGFDRSKLKEQLKHVQSVTINL